MILPKSVDEVRFRSDLTELVQMHKPVKNNTACCPFHDESTPSFHIYKSERYKCFGCGVYGDSISFTMAIGKLSFAEAVEWLATHYNITLEYDALSKEEAQEIRDSKAEMYKATEFAYGRYTKLLQALPADAPAIQYLESRGYNEEKRIRWGLGYAPADSKFVSTPLINANLHKAGAEVGVVVVKDGRTHDFMYNRIVIPIHDNNGQVIGTAGRLVPSGDKDADKKSPKYLNPKESIIYSKAKVWYGLWQAQKAIKERKFAYITEGYLDVQAMHDGGLDNTIASCGTEIDILQAKMLKRYCNEVCICYDGDDAGLNKAMKNIDTFLKLDFKVKVIELPNKMDPFDYFNTKEFFQADAVEVLPNNQEGPFDGAYAE